LRLRVKYITQVAEFFRRHIIRHMARQKRKPQGSGVYREAAIMSERLLKLSGADCKYV
jgi:hypothetical protein